MCVCDNMTCVGNLQHKYMSKHQRVEYKTVQNSTQLSTIEKEIRALILHPCVILK